jgi:CRP/FNR family transcriptional regulator, nitrogen fixation regulation protein
MSLQTVDQNAFSLSRVGRTMRNVSIDIVPTKLTGTMACFARGATIYRQGDESDDLYKVVEGVVRSCKLLRDGRRQIGAFYLPGDMFGLEPGEQHMFSAEAITETQVLVVKRGVATPFQLQDLMRRELQLAQNHILLLIKTAPERVASFLLEMAERAQPSEHIELLMSRQDMADYLGLRIETVCRMLKQLEKESTIALPTSQRVVLRNRVALKRLACREEGALQLVRPRLKARLT